MLAFPHTDIILMVPLTIFFFFQIKMLIFFFNQMFSFPFQFQYLFLALLSSKVNCALNPLKINTHYSFSFLYI